MPRKSKEEATLYQRLRRAKLRAKALEAPPTGFGGDWDLFETAAQLAKALRIMNSVFKNNKPEVIVQANEALAAWHEYWEND